MPGVDLKALGYLVSTVSVLFLATVAWPTPGEPRWMAIAVVVGVATSVLGMFLRYLSHRKTEHKVDRAREESGSYPREEACDAR